MFSWMIAVLARARIEDPVIDAQSEAIAESLIKNAR